MVVAGAEVLALDKRIPEFERVLGKERFENEILREAVNVAPGRPNFAIAVITRRRRRSPQSDGIAEAFVKTSERAFA